MERLDLGLGEQLAGIDGTLGLGTPLDGQGLDDLTWRARRSSRSLYTLFSLRTSSSGRTLSSFDTLRTRQTRRTSRADGSRASSHSSLSFRSGGSMRARQTSISLLSL